VTNDYNPDHLALSLQIQPVNAESSQQHSFSYHQALQLALKSIENLIGTKITHVIVFSHPGGFIAATQVLLFTSQGLPQVRDRTESTMEYSGAPDPSLPRRLQQS